ncbi:hypothetical protein F993_00044 [Acinetobacter proteolyticus]|uniref:Uncharacterized protein n=1 Tax=Acinetobacter proteolyticus TaxID=1776741 RepID=A0ABN0JJ27_9GAMM|nr:hypothetical protein [Acinetobacter proteolyticus]ENU25270.1 hypothetical protein F993_00044 [Acinetobacter proteolyticus]
MNSMNHRNELIKLVKELSSEDMVWILHVLNKDKLICKLKSDDIEDDDIELIEMDIEKLNSSKNLNEIKLNLTREISNFHEDLAADLIHYFNEYKDLLSIRGRDISQYQSNNRLLIFTLNEIKIRDREISKLINSISNPYIRFLYIIFIFREYYRNNRELDYIEKTYAQLMTEKSLHFKKYDHVAFYKWAKNYMDEDQDNYRKFNNSLITPIEDSDFSIVVNSIFDRMYIENPHVYSALKDKLANAWYQKIYRTKNKGKAHRYFLTDKALESLKVLSLKYDKSEEKMIEHLINKCFVEECADYSGQSMYSC